MERASKWCSGVLLVIATACADVPVERVTVAEAWARPSGEGSNAAAYLTIVNADSVALHIDSISTTQALAAELHETVLTDGISRMTALAGLDIAPGERLTMEPGGVHLMLVEITRPMNRGDSVAVRLHLSNAAPIDAFVQVRAP